MGRPLRQSEFDQPNRASDELRGAPLVSGDDEDSTDLLRLEAEMLDHLLGPEIAALFEE